ncbi:MAG: hypothetical protein KGH71_03805 [Candidatus Micrarchaeota archaeon]|nr:hypothetical protein [Candidatus Micrarchaeota archaeon]
MEQNIGEDGTAHAGHKHVHPIHAGQVKHDLIWTYAFIIAIVVGALVTVINYFNGNQIYAIAAAGGVLTLIPLYYRKYRIATILMTILIIIITIAYRISLLHFFGFYEPDGFYHYSVIRAAILHNFVVPQYLSISGWPNSTFVNEPTGMYWVTLIPYFFLQFVGISYYDVMRLIPVFFAVIDVIGTYFLIREFNKDRLFGLLGMLFVALSMGDAARTSATVYRGDGFVTIFVILGLIFMIRTLKAVDKKKMLGYALLTGFALSIGNVVWNGASFGIAIYIFATVLILLYAFLAEKIEILKGTRYLMLALLFWYVLTNLYKALNLIGIGSQSEAFTGIYFIVLFALLIIGNELAIYLNNNKDRFSMYVATLPKKLTTFVLYLIVAIVFIYTLAPQIVTAIFVTNGFVTNTAFAASIQELQAPTPSFLFASFGATLFMAPMSILLYVSSYYPALIDAFWIALMVLAAMYLFMDFEGVEKNTFLSGRALIKFRVDEAMLVFIAYYAITAYLQMHAVRFNSLLSIPLAIFTAYTIYWVLLAQKSLGRVASASLAVFAGLLMFSIVFNALGIAWAYFAGIIIACAIIYWALEKIHDTNISIAFGLVVVVVLVGYLMLIDTGYSVTLAQADNINPGFIQAMHWISNNTAPNSVFLTLWPDGSLVEGVANRTSVTDSVGSQNKSKAGPFAVWLFNTTQNPQFLTSSINGRPDYILARYTWLQETSGIYTETQFNATNYNQTLINMLINTNFKGSTISQLNKTQRASLDTMISQLYAYSVFDSFQENVNATNQTYTFLSNSQGLVAKVLIGTVNGTQRLNSYLQVGQYISPFKSVVFYNQLNGSYQILNQNLNRTNNQTLLIQYSPVPKQGAYVNITSVYMMNIGIANSNMFKLLFTCGTTYCQWSNNVASLQLVYANSDSKIFRIVYNSTVT